MSALHWIIERDVVDEANIQKMTDRLSEEGVPFSIVRVVPFTHEVDGRMPRIAEGASVMCYGSIGLGAAARKYGWTPGVWSGDEINETRLIREFGERYLNHDAIIRRFDEVSPDDLPATAFIKPDGDTKSFSGEVVARENFLSWRDRMLSSGYLDESALSENIVIAVPKVIGCEWRTFVVDGSPVTSSCYKQYRKVMPEAWMPEPAQDFVKQCIAAYDPLPGYALDVCQVEDGSFRVVEMNTLNSAGFYACDPAVVVSAVNRRLTGPVSDFQSSPV